MKKLLCVICLLLTAAMLFSMTALAAENDADAIYAVAITVDGDDIILADAPDTDTIGDLDSYELIIEDEPVLTVEQSDIPDLTSGTGDTGYFSVDFAIPDTTKTVFLAGLSADKVEEIQQKIIDNYASGADFELEDLSFIDAEKMYPENDGDDLLCWAATTANMLTYTGWAAQAGFATTDDVFEDFISAFTDKGGITYYGIGWFLDGVNTVISLDPSNGTSAATGTGGYLKDYAYDMVSSEINISGNRIDGMNSLHDSLRDGCGVGLSLDMFSKGKYYGGHAITCWGYIADTAYDSGEAAYFSGLFITDSDSDEPETGDRRDAKNILQAVSLTSGADRDSKETFEFDLDSVNHAALRSFTGLIPYSDDIEKETSPDATRDKANTADLSVTNAYLGTDLNASDYQYRMDKIESNTAFYYTPSMADEADADYYGSTRIDITMTNADGEVAYTRTLNYTFSIPSSYFTDFMTSLQLTTGLPEGDYTITITVNSDHAVSEAYYYNNTYSFPLKVRDSYLYGDTDGDGVVGIMDATKIQRILAGYNEGVDDKMIRRGSVTDDYFQIMDATQIQRYLASYSVVYPIGEKQLYD